MSPDPTRAVRLRIAGVPYSQIATQMGISEATVKQIVADELVSVAAEDRGTNARLDLARLDSLLMSVWKQASRGDSDAVNQALKITHQRAGLLAQLRDEPLPEEGGGLSMADRLARVKEQNTRPAEVFQIVSEEVGDE